MLITLIDLGLIFIKHSQLAQKIQTNCHTLSILKNPKISKILLILFHKNITASRLNP